MKANQVVSVRDVIHDALEELGVDDHRRKVTNRIVKRLAEQKPCVASWVAELGVLKFVGYVNTNRPTAIRDVPYARDCVPVYMTQEVE